MQENKNLIRDSIKHVSVYIILCAAHLTPRQHRKCWTRPLAATLAAPFVNFAKLREREIAAGASSQTLDTGHRTAAAAVVVADC